MCAGPGLFRLHIAMSQHLVLDVFENLKGFFTGGMRVRSFAGKPTSAKASGSIAYLSN